MTFRALLIGNWEYQHPNGGMTALRGPRHDLKRIGEAITHPKYGLFTAANVDIRENLTTSEMSVALASAAAASQPDDVLLIYYSGHGERLGQHQRLGLVGVDVPYQQRHALALNTTSLAEWLDEARARSTILILDCCYSGQYRGDFVDDDVLSNFQGTMVLSSGGNQVVPDEGSADGPSAFTAALAGVLIDETLEGTRGYLTADDVFAALNRVEPRLQPQPHRRLNGRGQVRLAARPKPPAPGSDVRELPGWPDRLRVIPVAVDFAEDHVVARWDRDRDGTVSNDERDVTALSPTRLAAVRRLCQMADAVMRAKDYSDPKWQRRARRALETAGVNLFEAALPPALQELIRSADADDDLVVRLDLSFHPPWSSLAEYPWEYLHVPTEPPTDTSGQGQRHLIVSRAGMSRERPARTADKTDVAVVSSLTAPFNRLAQRVGLELMAMPSVRTLSVPSDYPASYAQLMDAVDQEPEYLVVCAPLKRNSTDVGVSAQLGFGAGVDIDWRDVSTLAADLRSATRLRAVIISSVAADAALDAVRAAPTVAGRLNKDLGLPIVFVCHTPGLERYVMTQMDDDAHTFVGLLLEALSTGRALDLSVWFARYRVLRYIPYDLQPTFGIPGFFDRQVSIEHPHTPPLASRVPGSAVNRVRPKE